jgi:hypothetical protein
MTAIGTAAGDCPVFSVRTHHRLHRRDNENFPFR